jgi:hypothetical protein
MLSIVLLMLTGTLVGNEICIALFVHPTLYQLPDECHLRAVKPIASLLGRVMPFWYFAVFALGLAECYFSRGTGATVRYLLYAFTGLVGLSVVFSLLGPVPINNRISKLDPVHPPENWRELRQRWDRLNLIRVAVLLIALFLLVSGEVMGRR